MTVNELFAAAYGLLDVFGLGNAILAVAIIVVASTLWYVLVKRGD